jgi:hypothetical protein
VSKTISKKLLYVVVALAMLAMMIPAMAVPVSAASPNLTMTLIDPITSTTTTPEANPGFNVSGSKVLVTANDLGNLTVTNWSILNISSEPTSGANQAIIVSSTATTAIAQGVWGDAQIQATLSDNSTISIEKKWGQIESTTISAPGYSPVTWNEAAKAWFGSATINDNVTGAFYEKDPLTVPVDPSRPHILFHAAEGVILNWFLVPGNKFVSTAEGKTGALITSVLALGVPSHVSFAQGSMVTTMRTVTGASGSSALPIYATGEEAVQIVIIPEYPFNQGVNINVIPEVTSWDFYTTEMDVVPQVRWAGEKIVLEKNFGTTYTGQWVKFSIQNQSVGALEGIIGNTNFLNSNAVWTVIDDNGTASVILVSSDEGVAQVTASLYDVGEDENVTFLDSGAMINQHFFTVYFLKFESITIGDVTGKRTLHNAGPWEIIPGGRTNPWDPTGSYLGSQNPTVADNVTQTLNVSQDALVRARVKGWFTSSNPSVRVERRIDYTNSTLTDPGTANLLLPAGRWVLPDDWAALAGPNWKSSRLHWDIMCDPDGTVGALNNVLGDYKMPPITGTVVGAANVIGPFSPGLELMTPMGWQIVNSPAWDAMRPFNTVVPDGKLDVWDAPMPSAKVIFQIQDIAAGVTSAEAGFFKAVDKAQVYYINTASGVVYTNPFYQAYIPAHQAIPSFINNGGYDWNSFDPSYGPYVFWEFINQHSYTPLVASTDPSGHPTCVEVYSDNHGEAMVWLNGNWNLNLMPWLYQTSSVNIPIGATVGTTTVQATADYPYSRLHQAVQSNLDVKTWIWGQQVLGTDTHDFSGSPTVTTVTADTRMVLSVGDWDHDTQIGTFPNEAAKSVEKMVWVWITDRDGQRAGVTGAQVAWSVAPTRGAGAKIATGTGMGISQYNDVTKNIWLADGFLAGTSGAVTNGTARTTGTSIVRVPTSWEVQLFNKFWGSPVSNPANTQGTSNIRADASKYLVAGIKVVSESGYNSRVAVNIEITSHDFDLYMGQAVQGTVRYETDVDFDVIDALDDGIKTGDANCDGAVNMGDVTAVERMILGYTPVTSNAVVNNDGTVDMGTVVKIERNILGLK